LKLLQNTISWSRHNYFLLVTWTLLLQCVCKVDEVISDLP